MVCLCACACLCKCVFFWDGGIGEKKKLAWGFHAAFFFPPAVRVKTTCATSAVKLLPSASQHLRMTGNLAGLKRSAEVLTKLGHLLAAVAELPKKNEK